METLHQTIHSQSRFLRMKNRFHTPKSTSKSFDETYIFKKINLVADKLDANK